MRQSIVPDCSVTASWFLKNEQGHASEKVLADICSEQIEMIVPDLWWYEVMNVIRSATLRKRLHDHEAKKIYGFLRSIPKKMVEIGESGQYGILKLAMDEKLSVYDAAYLYLAITTGSLLMTSDKNLISLKTKYTFICDLSENE